MSFKAVTAPQIPFRVSPGRQAGGSGRLGRAPAPSLSPSKSLHFNLLYTLCFHLRCSLNKGCSGQKVWINDFLGFFLGMLELTTVVTRTRADIILVFCPRKSLGNHSALHVLASFFLFSSFPPSSPAFLPPFHPCFVPEAETQFPYLIP